MGSNKRQPYYIDSYGNLYFPSETDQCNDRGHANRTVSKQPVEYVGMFSRYRIKLVSTNDPRGDYASFRHARKRVISRMKIDAVRAQLECIIEDKPDNKIVIQRKEIYE